MTSAAGAPFILHVASDGLDWAAAQRLATLREAHCDTSPRRARLVSLGGSRGETPQPDHRLARPLSSWYAARRLGAIARRCAEPSCPLVLHVWAEQVLGPAVGLARTRALSGAAQVLFEADAPARVDRLTRWINAAQPARVTCVVSTAHRRRQLLASGVAPRDVALVAAAVDAGRFAAVDRQAVRTRLRLAPQHTAVLLLPPLSDSTTPLLGAWGAMLVEKVHRQVRVIMPAGGSQAPRIRALARATLHEHMFVQGSADLSPLELLSACDVIAFSPRDARADTRMLPWAMASGKPLLAAGLPCVAEFVTHAESAWLFSASVPRDAGRGLLEMLDAPQPAASLGARARGLALARYDLQRMLAAYSQLYSAPRAADPGERVPS